MQYKKEAVRIKLIEAGRKEYLEHGYRAGNISRIAQNAGVPVGNLYRYFDGKAGLLDAIVGPAYNEIPKIIEHMAKITSTVKMDELIGLISRTLVNIYKTYGEDLLILADKCESTKYDDFTAKLSSLACDIFLKYLYTQPTENDKIFVAILGKTFIHSFFDVFRLKDADLMEEMIRRLLVFDFDKIDSRI